MTDKGIRNMQRAATQTQIRLELYKVMVQLEEMPYKAREEVKAEAEKQGKEFSLYWTEDDRDFYDDLQEISKKAAHLSELCKSSINSYTQEYPEALMPRKKARIIKFSDYLGA